MEMNSGSYEFNIFPGSKDLGRSFPKPVTEVVINLLGLVAAPWTSRFLEGKSYLYSALWTDFWTGKSVCTVHCGQVENYLFIQTRGNSPIMTDILKHCRAKNKVGSSIFTPKVIGGKS
jgi:hypothetical protein